MTKKKKACIIIGSICLFLILLAAVLSQFIAVNMNDFVLTVVFDKHEVMNADKIVLREGDRSVTITDPKLIREIASEFVVANTSEMCGYYQDKWMEIYNGDKLVRNIHWNDHDDLVVVYERDLTHWVSYSRLGQISLKDETVQMLKDIMDNE